MLTPLKLCWGKHKTWLFYTHTHTKKKSIAQYQKIKYWLKYSYIKGKHQKKKEKKCDRKYAVFSTVATVTCIILHNFLEQRTVLHVYNFRKTKSKGIESFYQVLHDIWAKSWGNPSLGKCGPGMSQNSWYIQKVWSEPLLLLWQRRGTGLSKNWLTAVLILLDV